uniref:Uncharacterized protein n=1 Tax=Anguilla anguilla TaxID=7936 RepID=A0A0E9QSA9_ANGAN
MYCKARSVNFHGCSHFSDRRSQLF